MLSTFWCRAAHCNPVFPVQSLFVLHRKLPNSFCIEGWHDSTVDAITTVASRKMQPTSKMKMFGKVKLKLKILFHVTCQYSGLVLPLLLGDPEPRWRHQDVGVLQLPDGPNIPWLFLPFQNWLLVIDDGDLFLWLLAKLVTRFEGSQLRFISCKIWFWSHIHQFWGKLSQPKLTLKNTWLSLSLFFIFTISETQSWPATIKNDEDITGIEGGCTIWIRKKPSLPESQSSPNWNTMCAKQILLSINYNQWVYN